MHLSCLYCTRLSHTLAVCSACRAAQQVRHLLLVVKDLLLCCVSMQNKLNVSCCYSF